MLGKMIKHEWRNSYKICGIILLVVMGVSLWGAFYLSTPLWEKLFDSADMNSLFMLQFGAGMSTLMVYVLTMIGASYGVGIFLLIRFWRSMYSDEGYLTHTLLSKLLISGIWMLIINVTVGLSVVVLVSVFMKGVMTGREWEYFLFVLNDELAFRNYTAHEVYAAIIGLLGGLLSPFVTMSVYFGSLSLGQLSRSHKGLMGILACILILFLRMIVLSLLSGIISLLLSYNSTIENIAIISGAVELVLELALGVGFYFLTIYLMKNKLNLE